jgi:hypothetical protein
VNYERLYDFRFRDINQSKRQEVWNEIGSYVYRLLGEPARVVDPSAGRCEFLNAIPAAERWSIDQVDNSAYRQPGIRGLTSDIFSAELPTEYFDGVFVSNFLEHLERQEEVALFLERMHEVCEPEGSIAIVGPNFRYCSREYFDCADHTLALTHVSVAEHLYAAGFTIERVVPRFLPFSFRSALPASAAMTRWYLKLPIAWRALGKQFLVVGRRTNGAATVVSNSVVT